MCKLIYLIPKLPIEIILLIDKYVKTLQSKKYSKLVKIRTYKRYNKIIRANTLAMANAKIQKITIALIAATIYTSYDLQLEENNTF